MSNGAGEPGDHQLTQSAITSANETACYHLGRDAKREGGDLIHQSLTTPGTVLQALIDAAGPDTVEYRAAVAYVTGDGARRLAEGLAEKLGPAWTGMPKVIVTCFDFGSTDLAALDLLRDEHNFEVRIANLQPGAAVALVGQSSFHPKVYLAYGSGDHVTAVIGSANLGRRALTVNTEVVTTTTVSRSEADAMWSELQDSSVVLTEELAAAYIAARPQRLKAPRQVEPPSLRRLRQSPCPSFVKSLRADLWCPPTTKRSGSRSADQAAVPAISLSYHAELNASSVTPSMTTTTSTT